MIKFNRYCVTDGASKARCFYHIGQRIDGRACVTIYARDFDSGDALRRMFGAEAYHNFTDAMTDLFDEGNVDLFETHPLYEAARNRAAWNEAKNNEKREAKIAAARKRRAEILTKQIRVAWRAP